MNKEVSFPIAKLLKEKGYEEPTKKHYEYALKSQKNQEDGYSGPFGWEKGELILQSHYFINNHKQADLSSEMWYMCSAPTIAEVIMWLYEKHEYWCYAYTNGKIWHPCIQHKFGDMAVLSGKIGEFNSPTKAYEAAFEYTLNNLTQNK